MMAKNGGFKAPSQSPSGGRENLSSIYPNKFRTHNAENPKGLSFFSTFLNCLVLCSWFSVHGSLLMVLCSKKYRGSSNVRTAPALTSYLLYFFSMSQIFCTRSACLPPSNLAPKNASRIFFASSSPTTRAPNAMICALLCLTVISAE